MIVKSRRRWQIRLCLPLGMLCDPRLWEANLPSFLSTTRRLSCRGSDSHLHGAYRIDAPKIEGYIAGMNLHAIYSKSAAHTQMNSWYRSCSPFESIFPACLCTMLNVLALWHDNLSKARLGRSRMKSVSASKGIDLVVRTATVVGEKVCRDVLSGRRARPRRVLVHRPWQEG